MHMTEVRKSTFQNVNDLIKTLIWPVILLLLLILYGKPIGKTINLLPGKLEQSSKVSVGSLSFEIEKTAISTGNRDLADMIKNLSETSLRKLLTIGYGSLIFTVSSEYDKNGKGEKRYLTPQHIVEFQELEKNKLIAGEESIDNFLKYFKSLGAIEETRYSNDDGTTTYSSTTQSNHPYTELSLLVSKLSVEDEKRIAKYSIELTDKGKKAVDIIVKVIAEQIGNR